MTDHYQTLGVSKSATQEDIKAAYRRCAMKHHPDRNPGDAQSEARFKQCQAAYDVLGDEKKRRMYDLGGQSPFRGGAFSDDIQWSTEGSVEDLFRTIFGDRGGFSRPSPSTGGDDIQLSLTISLEQALLGGEHTIEYRVQRVCEPCDGTGSQSKTTTQCPTCQGNGQVRSKRGIFTTARTCPDCDGKGTTCSDPCAVCAGSGVKTHVEAQNIKIPPGIDTGDRIRFPGYGHHGTPPGDLYIQINVAPHDSIQRQGLDLHIPLSIRFSQAALGAEVGVKTPLGAHNVKVPAGTTASTRLRLKGKGVVSPHSQVAGDLICHVVIETPVNLTKKQRAILQDFEKSFK